MLQEICSYSSSRSKAEYGLIMVTTISTQTFICSCRKNKKENIYSVSVSITK